MCISGKLQCAAGSLEQRAITREIEFVSIGAASAQFVYVWGGGSDCGPEDRYANRGGRQRRGGAEPLSRLLRRCATGEAFTNSYSITSLADPGGGAKDARTPSWSMQFSVKSLPDNRFLPKTQRLALAFPENPIRP